jgi:hypothetical protein
VRMQDGAGGETLRNRSTLPLIPTVTRVLEMSMSKADTGTPGGGSM